MMDTLIKKSIKIKICIHHANSVRYIEICIGLVYITITVVETLNQIRMMPEVLYMGVQGLRRVSVFDLFGRYAV